MCVCVCVCVCIYTYMLGHQPRLIIFEFVFHHFRTELDLKSCRRFQWQCKRIFELKNIVFNWELSSLVLKFYNSNWYIQCE